MERQGATKYVGNVEKHDILGEYTYFRQLAEQFVIKVVEQGKWFSFGNNKTEQVDILSILNNQNRKFGSMVASMFEYTPYKQAVYKYMLHDFLCYYESPIVKKETNLNGFKNSYNKYLVTSNINVVAEWLDIPVEEADKLYGARLSEVDIDNEEVYYQYVKLYADKSGVHKVTRPKVDLDLSTSGIRLTPVFALKAGVDYLFKQLSEGTYDVTFCKDSGQERVICTTFNKDLIVDLYKNEKFVNKHFTESYDGDFLANSTLERGYIRIFELGSSIHNYPMRSINYARILKFEKADPDMSYMNIDLDNVLCIFIESIYSDSFRNVDIEEVVDALDMFDVGTSREVFNVRIDSVSKLENWANSQNILLSTVFIRQLALFMIGNPQWFNGYTGEPKQSGSGSADSSLNGDEGAIPTDVDLSLPFF